MLISFVYCKNKQQGWKHDMLNEQKYNYNNNLKKKRIMIEWAAIH